MDNLEEFNRQYMGTFEISEKDIELQNIAKQYHDACDKYDDHVCTGWSHSDNCSMPVNNRQLQLVNRNAQLVRLRLVRENQQFTSDEIRKAISRYVR